jgi:hypothetical protein
LRAAKISGPVKRKPGTVSTVPERTIPIRSLYLLTNSTAVYSDGRVWTTTGT